jgi:methylphosphotriester-DNA--protein-cysteine methyltransferase
MHWRLFDDFDAWADTIRTADLRLACDSAEWREWRHVAMSVGDVLLQVAEEGGGNLCHGANTHSGPILFLPLTHVDRHVVNCTPLDAGSLLVIPPGADFSIQVRHRAHAWCSVALPAAETAAGGHHPTGRQASRVLQPGEPRVRMLKDLMWRIMFGPLADAGPGPAHDTAAAEIIAAARACLATPSAAAGPPRGRPRIDRGEVIRRSVSLLEAESLGRPTVAGLAGSVGVTERTLARAFHDTFGVSPLRYMSLRQLHRVRRTLRSVSDAATVSAVLMQHGIWEHGRFAGRYRRHFGESPAETLRRRRLAPA